MDIIESISNISNHKYQNIVSNMFQQGLPYVKSYVQFNNGYVKIPKVEPVVIFKTIFEKFVYHFDNMLTIDNLSEYKNRFFGMISEEVYKSVSRRHNILKKDTFSFIHETEFKIPTNKDVIMLMCSIIKYNVIILEKKMYTKYILDDNYKVLLISNVDNGVIYDNVVEVEMKLRSDHKYENVDFASMKLSDIKEYIKINNIEISKDIKKKEDIINHLSEIKN